MSNDDNLRTDARENRNRILDVARDALAVDPGASLNSIAKAAGIGAGTLYRHFPNRESLVLAVYRSEIEEIVALAPALLERHQPLTAFRLWCERLAKFGRMKRGIADVIREVKSALDFQKTYGPLLDAVRKLMKACEDAGDIRHGANAEDFFVLLGFLWQLPPNSEGQERVKRLLTLIFRGLGAKD